MALSRPARPDILSTLYEVDKKTNRLICKVCRDTFKARITLKRHVSRFHPDKLIEEPDLTPEDLKLEQEFDMLGIPRKAHLRFRKYACLHYDMKAKRPDFAFMPLSRNVFNVAEVRPENDLRDVGRDPLLPDSSQLKREDFRQINLPLNYEKGHLLSRDHYRWSKDIFFHIDLCSLCAIQHKDLNRTLWRNLEHYARGQALVRKVRVLAGTQGQLDLPKSCPAEIPRFFYMIILSSDFNDQNWNYTAHVFPNKACTSPLSEYEVSIHDVIELTGYPFFHKIIGNMKTPFRRVFRDETFEEWAERRWFSDEEDDGDNDYVPPPKKYKKGELRL